MKKILYSIFAITICVNAANAGVVVSNMAQSVATNFYSQNTQKQVSDISLAYTATSSSGEPLYYAFNVNGSEGFVIISAEDAGHPILGYSTEGNFQVPSANSNPEFNYWMENRKSEIVSMRKQNLQPDQETTNEWTSYATNKKYSPVVMSTPHAALCQTKWNQNGGGTVPYNNLCPGGSVTGCVATAMAQIMKFWAFPTQGVGSHSYSAGTYGTLSANFGATTYNWASMPLTSSNAAVATISYHCGVAVDMSYSPSGSGAMVCGGNPSAEYAYKTYFKYDPAIHCEGQTSYSTATWCAMLVAEFAAGRPVQYQGTSTSGGHTWVCDGNDASDNMHMNWGWAGSSNGYFAVTNLNPAGDVFNTQLAGLFYIKPQIATGPLDAGTTAISTPNGTTCSTSITPIVTIKNFGSSTLTSCTVNYKIDAGTVQTFNWTGSVASFQTANATLPAISTTVGAHTFTSFTSSPNGGTDALASNDQMQSNFIVMMGTASKQAPYSEGFENSGFPYADNYVMSPAGPQWSTTTAAATTGTSSMKLDNFSPTTGDVDEFITPGIDMSTITNQTMTFQLAHAQRSATDNDALIVYTSTNCGAAWTQRYSKPGSALTTAGVVGSAFTPTASQWRLETVNIANVTGQPDVRFKFKFTSAGAGNNIYIDDINITGTSNGVAEEFINSFNLNVYPNPFTESTTISFNILDKYNVAIGVYDIVGKEVIALTKPSELGAGSYSLPLNRGVLKAGIYFVKMNVDGYSVMKKMIVQ
jgi:hypothetical protein